MFGFLSGQELLIVVVVLLLLFGGSQIPKLARSLGQAQREFKEGIAEGESGGDADDAEKSQKKDA